VKFLRQEYIITTISNKEVSDLETIKNVLNNLKKENIEFSLVTQKPSDLGYSNLRLSYEKVRVKSVNENSVDFIVFNKSSMTNITDISFNNLIEIVAITKKNNILEAENATDRFGLMDIEEKEE